MISMKQRKKLFGLFMGLTVMASGAFLANDACVVNAAEKKVVTSVDDSSSYKDILEMIDDYSLVEDAEWVEALVQSESGTIVKRVWFSLEDEEWNLPISDLENGHYMVSLYDVDGKKVKHEVGIDPITKVDFTLGKMSYTSLDAKATSNKKSGKPSITVQLKGLKSPCVMKKVIFSVQNKKGTVVFEKALKANEKGNYKVEIPASKLGGKPGRYKVTAKVKTACGKETKLKGSASTELKFGKATLKVTNVNKKKGTFTFKVAAIKTSDSIKDVSMKVWCKKSDAKVYNNLKKNSDGSYAVDVDVTKHNYHFGKYHAELIVTLKNGSKTKLATKSYDFKPKNFMRYGEVTQKNKKTIWMYNPTAEGIVYVDVWSKASKGADKTSYEVVSKKSALKLTVDMKKLTSSGKIFVLYKQKSGDTYTTLKKVSFNATDNDINKHGWFYEKASNGKIYKYYYRNGKKVTDLTDVLNIKNQNMYIEVNKQQCTVTVYAKDDKTGKWNVPVIAFACSPGNPTSLTPSGTYHTLEKYRWHELMGPSYGQYCTRIVGGVLFHSVAGYNMTSYNINAYSYNKLGTPASHGCVRLCVRDAKWIYDHCTIGTTVHIFNSDFKGPLGKPATIKIQEGQHYDPTDPAIKK